MISRVFHNLKVRSTRFSNFMCLGCNKEIPARTTSIGVWEDDFFTGEIYHIGCFINKCINFSEHSKHKNNCILCGKEIKGICIKFETSKAHLSCVFNFILDFLLEDLKNGNKG